MQMQIETIQIDIPKDMEDVTTYVFRSEDDDEELMITFDQSEPNGSDLDAVFADRREQVEMFLADEMSIEYEGSATLDGAQARILVFTFQDGDKSYRNRWVLLELRGEVFILLAYLTPLGQDPDSVVFEHILESISLQPGSMDNQPPKGYVRYNVRHIVLDVPQHLLPPQTYRFATEDERFEMEVAVYKPDMPLHQPPTFDQEISFETATDAVIVAQKIVPGPSPPLRGQIRQYILRREDDGKVVENILRLAHFLFSNHIEVHLSIRAPHDALPELESRWVEVVGKR